MAHKLNGADIKGFLRNPLFYFFLAPFVLFGVLFFSSDSLAKPVPWGNSDVVFFNASPLDFQGTTSDDLFFKQGNAVAFEAPDFKITQDHFLYGVSVPSSFKPQVLGALAGDASIVEERQEIIDYIVQSGDTVDSVARQFGLSVNTIIWANNISKNTPLKVGQNLVILPVDGVLHLVRLGDMVSRIALRYRAKAEDIIADNGLQDKDDIYPGDKFVVKGGIMPKIAIPVIEYVPLAKNSLMPPTKGYISNGRHSVNAFDIANKCGTPIYAVASGIIQRAVSNGSGYRGSNYITLKLANGVVIYYGHVKSIFVKPGQIVDRGERIALMGGEPGTLGAGRSTGCHLHYDVIGAEHPLVNLPVGGPIEF